MGKDAINKGTELMLRRRQAKEPASPVLKQIGTDFSLSLLRRKFRLRLNLSWEKITDD